jgi:phosphoserine phosphatase
MKARLHEAQSVVEEINRMTGLARLVQQVEASGNKTLEVMSGLKKMTQHLAAEECSYVAWGLA